MEGNYIGICYKIFQCNWAICSSCLKFSHIFWPSNFVLKDKPKNLLLKNFKDLYTKNVGRGVICNSDVEIHYNIISEN